MKSAKSILNARGVSKRTPATNQAGGPAPAGARSNFKNEELTIALQESLKLQSHYAKLLNMYDSGKRMQFDSMHAWIARLRETGTLQKRIAGGTPAAR